MKIVYFGTPDFAVLPLKNIVNNGYEVVAVVSQPDKPVGRKQIMTPSAVKETALSFNIPVYTFNIVSKEGVELLKSLNADLFVTCAYGQILSSEILAIPPLGTINIHASLLPKLRGSSPIQWAIINGEKETGVTIMMTDIGVDTGDIILSKKITIDDNETAGELFDRLSTLGADAVIDALKLFDEGKVVKTPQNHLEATHTKMLTKEFGKIDFNQPATKIHDLVRGLNPWPVAFTSICGEVVKIYKTTPVDASGKVGEVLSSDPKNGLIIACKHGAIKILELQRQGGKRLNADDFLRGYKIKVGILIND